MSVQLNWPFSPCTTCKDKRVASVFAGLRLFRESMPECHCDTDTSSETLLQTDTTLARVFPQESNHRAPQDKKKKKKKKTLLFVKGHFHCPRRGIACLKHLFFYSQAFEVDDYRRARFLGGKKKLVCSVVHSTYRTKRTIPN